MKYLYNIIITLALLIAAPVTQAAFDRTDPTDLAALKSEVNADPIGMGYDTNGGTPPLLSQLNTPSSNVGGETTGEDFTPDLALEVIDPDEVTVGPKFTEGQSTWLGYLMSAADSVSLFSSFEPKFRALFAGYTPSSNTLDALNARVQLLSRAEVLFGIDTVISKADWLAARDS